MGIVRSIARRAGRIKGGKGRTGGKHPSPIRATQAAADKVFDWIQMEITTLKRR